MVYGVFPRELWILWTYWVWLTIVARAGGYYGSPFKGYYGGNQGDPFPSTLFNVVVEAGIHHCVMMVAESVEGTEGLGLSIQDLLAYLNDDDGIVASIQPERLQWSFNVLTCLFNWFIFRKNTQKTVSTAL